jgi:hypothetical protein
MFRDKVIVNSIFVSHFPLNIVKLFFINLQKKNASKGILKVSLLKCEINYTPFCGGIHVLSLILRVKILSQILRGKLIKNSSSFINLKKMFYRNLKLQN